MEEEHDTTKVSRWKRYGIARRLPLNWELSIPDHWRTHRLKEVADVRPSNVDKKSAEGEKAVRLCNYVDVYKNEKITADMDFMEATASDSQIEQFSIQAGDVIITKDSEEWNDIAVPAYVPEAIEGLVCGYHLTLIRPDTRHILGAYLARCLEAEGLSDQFRIMANGITRYGLGTQEIRCAIVPVPPVAEQRAISAFIDRETTRIDALIGHKERLIALLEEKRQAVISHAVTRGLDPNAKMVNSGVPWYAQHPDRWKLLPIGWLSEVCNGSTPSQAKEHYWTDGDIPWISSGEVNNSIISEPSARITEEAFRDTGLRIIPAGSVLMGMIGQGKTRGTSAILGIDACINQNLAAIIPGDGLNSEYLRYSLSHSYEPIRQIARGGNQGALNCELVRSIRILVPPIEEQQQIVSYLNEVSRNTADVVDLLSRHNEMLREYRTALIAAAVTGQIDVREEGSSA